MKDLILVVDGGRSYLRVFALDREGAEHGWERESGIPAVLADWGPTADRVVKACKKLFDKTGIKPSAFSVAVMGLAGLDRKEDQADFLQHFFEAGFPFKAIVESDARQALRAANPNDPVAIGLFGTGSAFFARGADREIYRTCGWGGLLGDVGSGFELAKEGFTAVFRSYDRVSPETSLTQKFCEMAGVTEVPEFLKFLYATTFDPAVWARYAPTVLREASKGDSVSLEIVDNQIDQVCKSLFGLTEKANMPPGTEIFLTGGLIEEGKFYFERLREKIEATVTTHPVRVLHRESYWGGWELGRQFLEGRVG
ncbi:MAG: hypothetical protein KC917_01150 [Candidatus Omnitrophica bacterium]|nr:hypothetical protein [Candidatus Omnitrophota bacterium]MCA9423570.1 hypothetical protein [Candidatus Omnitrophota bacterium]MCA9435059.1 hypothetical protein [Candidatus Omnitrophota bacterium]MCB9770482.1 hypothetical protein [Candidatus Omnitrophota bacterium]